MFLVFLLLQISRIPRRFSRTEFRYHQSFLVALRSQLYCKIAVFGLCQSFVLLFSFLRLFLGPTCATLRFVVDIIQVLPKVYNVGFHISV